MRIFYLIFCIETNFSSISDIFETYETFDIFKRGKNFRYKVECNLCKEQFDNDYARKHTATKHPDYEKQYRIAPFIEVGTKKRKKSGS